MLDRRSGPEDVRRAVHRLRGAGFENISLDLIYGIPGQSPPTSTGTSTEALALSPEHVSYYELEAKPGTRFTHAHGGELERQAEALEGYFERVVETLTGAGYRWYETANFCRPGREARHNLGYWLGHDYLGIGIGAVSTLGCGAAAEPAEARGVPSARVRPAATPPREIEPLDDATRLRERRACSGSGSTRPFRLADVEAALDPAGARAAWCNSAWSNGREARMRLTRRGRFLGGGGHRRAPRESPCKRLQSRLMAERLVPILTARQEAILARVVEAYVATGAPVGSKTLVEQGADRRVVVDGPKRAGRARGARAAHAPAHVGGARPDRAGLSVLRRPAARASRAASPAELPLDLSDARSQVEAALRTTTEALSEVTHLLALVSAPALETTTVRHVEVLLLQPELVMVVVITSTGGVTKQLVAFTDPVDPGLAEWAGEYLNECVAGHQLGARLDQSPFRRRRSSDRASERSSPRSGRRS